MRWHMHRLILAAVVRKQQMFANCRQDRIVCKLVALGWVRNTHWQVNCVGKKEKGTKDGSLWDSSWHSQPRGGCFIDSDTLAAVCQVAFKP